MLCPNECSDRVRNRRGAGPHQRVYVLAFRVRGVGFKGLGLGSMVEDSVRRI